MDSVQFHQAWNLNKVRLSRLQRVEAASAWLQSTQLPLLQQPGLPAGEKGGPQCTWLGGGLHLLPEVSCYLTTPLTWFAFNGLLVMFHLTYKNASIL